VACGTEYVPCTMLYVHALRCMHHNDAVGGRCWLRRGGMRQRVAVACAGSATLRINRAKRFSFSRGRKPRGPEDRGTGDRPNSGGTRGPGGGGFYLPPPPKPWSNLNFLGVRDVRDVCLPVLPGQKSRQRPLLLSGPITQTGLFKFDD
jgi:hypothetical protein